MNSELVYYWPDLLLMPTLAALEPFKTEAVYTHHKHSVYVCVRKKTHLKN